MTRTHDTHTYGCTRRHEPTSASVYGDACAVDLKLWYATHYATCAYTYTRTHVAGQAFRGLSHCDETPQARTYDEWAHEYALNAYRPDTLVWRDGGTREYVLCDRDTYRDTLGHANADTRVTYSRREALAWYAERGLVLVKTSCRTAPFEIWNAPKWLRRIYAGNGKIKFYHYGRDVLK